MHWAIERYLIWWIFVICQAVKKFYAEFSSYTVHTYVLGLK